MGFFKKLFGGSASTNPKNTAAETPAQPADYTPVTFENFFGVNVYDSPNEEWEFVGGEGTQFIFQHKNYAFKNDIFDDCVVQVDLKRKTSNFLFQGVYSEEAAYSLLFQIKRDFVLNGRYTMDQCETEFVFRIDDEDEDYPIIIEAGDVTFVYRYNGNINLGFVINSINEENIHLIAEKIGNKESSKSEDYHLEDKHYQDTFEIRYKDSEGKRQYKKVKNQNFFSRIVGVKYRPNAEEILDSIDEGDSVLLKKDPTNEFDPQAIAAYHNGVLVGYIPKKDIPAIAVCMEEDEIVVEVEYVDEDAISIIVPATFVGLNTVEEENYGPFSFIRIHKERVDEIYSEVNTPISKEEFLENL